VLSSLLFIIVTDQATRGSRKGTPWKLACTGDLVVTAETEQEAWELFEKWKDAMEIRGLRVNM